MTLKRIAKIFGVGLALGFLALLAGGNEGQIGLAQSCTVTLIPGRSIQEAIDRASSGAVICLSKGEWTENLAIKKSLTLRAEEIKPKPEAVIKSAKGGWPVIMIRSEDPIEVTIQGLKITGAFGGCYQEEAGWICAAGISVYGKAKAVIGSNTISGNWAGIWMLGSCQATIESNTISGSWEGILILGSCQATIANNKISDNRKDGIWITGSSQATIESNTISGSNTGILMWDSSQATIESNTISGNWAGILMLGSSQATVANNKISDNRDGIWMIGVGSCQAAIESNTISGNEVGILMWGSPQATITNNTISGNKVHGIVMEGSSQATIEGNTILDNKRYGVALGQRPCFDTALKFEGAVRGKNNEISGNKESNVCPEELQFLMTSAGGCYGPKCK